MYARVGAPREGLLDFRTRGVDAVALAGDGENGGLVKEKGLTPAEAKKARRDAKERAEELAPRATGAGRVAVVEICVVTERIKNFLTDPAELHQLEDAIAEGEFFGMQTFDQHLLTLYADGIVSLQDALNAATDQHDFRVSLRAAGLTK